MEKTLSLHPTETQLSPQGKLLPDIEPVSIAYTYAHAATSENTRKSYRKIFASLLLGVGYYRLPLM